MIPFNKQILWIVSIISTLGYAEGPQDKTAGDKTRYCQVVQNDVGFIRYPLGTIGVWSTELGEVADVMTRVPRIYPCLDSAVVKTATDDWRASMTGDPSILRIKYKSDKPPGGSAVAITNSPHVSVFQVTFPAGTQKKYLVFDFGKSRVDSWAALDKWNERSVERVDDRTIQSTIGKAGQPGAFFIVKCSVPFAGSGTIDSSGARIEGATRVTGTQLGMYARFDASIVTVAVAESFTSMNQTEAFFASEFTDFDEVHNRCHEAWNKVLNRVEIEGSETGKRMAYSALYTMYANILDGSDGSCYRNYTPRPKSVSSSAYWQFIGGYQSCCWDNFRTVYPFLMLGYPEVMSDVVNTYLARYQRDGCMTGDICLFTGPTDGHQNIRFSPVLMAQAYFTGIQADYSKIYSALKDNFNNNAFFPESFTELGYVTQPVSGGMACSRTLEFATGMHSMGLLAKAENDKEGLAKYLRLSKNYKNLWDSTNKAFRVKNTDGSWGPVDFKTWTWNPNPQGLFEGTTTDWMFAVPHDPYGLIRLPGQERFVERVIDYCLNDTWFNDYQYIYPYLLYYDGAANAAQKIIRRAWIPMFKEGIMYEEASPKNPERKSKAHYTSSAGWVICSVLGLYPMNSPAGQYIISSPSITKAVIHHGEKDITVQTRNNSDETIYISSIKVDGKEYPSYMIPAERLASGVKIDLEMSSDSTRGLGNLYIGSSDGFVRSAEMVSGARLKCVIEAAGIDAITQIFSCRKPSDVLINGKSDNSWIWDDVKKTATIKNTDTAQIVVIN